MIGPTFGYPYSIAMVPMISHGVLHFTDLKYFVMQSVTVLSLIALGAGIGRLPIGFLADWIEIHWIAVAIMSGLFFATIEFWAVSSMTLLTTSALVFGFCVGAGIVLVTTLIGNYYGSAAFARVTDVMNIYGALIATVVPLMAKIFATSITATTVCSSLFWPSKPSPL